MENDKRMQLLDALESDGYKKRLGLVNRFEEISGGGIRKQIERLLIAPSLYLPYLFYAKAHMSRVMRTSSTLFWGRPIKITLDDYDALILYMYGALYGAELHFAKFLIKNLGPDDVFYDVGANRGFYTFLGAELASETHSFEPMPGLADDIRASIRAEDRITINPVALSDADGSTDFFITKSTMVNTINASVAEHIATQNYYTVRKLKVPTVTLDAYVQTHAKPTIIKIDAEGAEEQILKGGFDFFASHAPIIAMEVWGKENNWELSTRAVELLARMGYRSYRLDSAGGVQEMRGDLTSHVVPAGGENFIFKK